MDDNVGTPKSSNHAVNQGMMQRVTVRASTTPLENWDTITTTRFNLFDNRQSAPISVEGTHTPILENRDTIQRSADDAYVTPFDNQKQMQKPIDSAYATLFNYRGSMEKNPYTTPIDNRGHIQEFVTSTSSSTDREYSELMYHSIHKTQFGYQDILDNVSGTFRKFDIV